MLSGRCRVIDDWCACRAYLADADTAAYAPAATQNEAEWASLRADADAKLSAAERRIKALEEQRDVLQQQLEKVAAETPGEGEDGHWLCWQASGVHDIDAFLSEL
jgi:hypothetical protein